MVNYTHAMLSLLSIAYTFYFRSLPIDTTYLEQESVEKNGNRRTISVGSESQNETFRTTDFQTYD